MYYLNTDTQAILFQEAVSGPYYADKSLFIKKINSFIRTDAKYICITRPRRFGKTVNANMLGAYYTKGRDSRSLFDGLKISGAPSCEKHLNKHNVVHIDFSTLPDLSPDFDTYLYNILQKLRMDLLKTYSWLEEKECLGISDLFLETGDSFIFIFDEWDSIFSQPFATEKDKNTFLLFLKNLLKDKPYVELAYMTGVLPIKKYSSDSELNMFDEYSFINDNQFDIFFGLLENEVKELCSRQTCLSYEELAQWYDGYRTSSGGHLFNPRSVNRALARGICLNYWTETGPMDEIADCVEHNVDQVKEDIVKMVSGIPVETELNGYSAVEQQLENRNEILSAMTIYGFLSYYNGQLQIPNCELMEKFQNVLSRDSMGELKEIVETSRQILEATLAADASKVAEMLETVHEREIPFLQYSDENSLSCVITLCYLYARKDYRIEREAKSGKVFCDYLFYPKKSGGTALILQLKAGASAASAIKQIRDKNYIQKVRSCSKILLIGISYDREKKKHECRIESCHG